MAKQLSGFFIDNASGKRTPGCLLIDNDGRVTSTDVTMEPFNFSVVVFSPFVNGTPRYVTLPGGDVFESSDHDDIEAVIKRFGMKSDREWRRSRRLLRLAALAIVLVCTWVFFHFGIPAISKNIAMMASNEMLVRMGQGSLKDLDENAAFSATQISDERQAALRERFNDLLPVNKDELTYRLHFRASPEEVGANALALPSGDIIVTDALVLLAEDDEEIDAVILHEVGHVYLRHGLQRVAQTSILMLAVVAISGDVNSLATLLAAVPALLLDAGYSRNMETEADEYALQYMLANHRNPMHFANILQRMQDSDDARYSKYWSTHPHSKERVERFCVVQDALSSPLE